MDRIKLTEDQYKKLGELLSSAVKNKEVLHVSDERRAAVLIFSLIQKGYYFWERELENIMEFSDGNYSVDAEETLKEITWVCNELANGLESPENEQFKLKDFEYY